MSTEPIEGFWSRPQSINSPVYHYFIADDQESICGKWRIREMSEVREDRRPGKDDCLKCVDIHRELHAPQIPAAPAPDWTVKTDPIEGHHTLHYQGKPQSTVRGPGGLATQKELAAIFNRNGTLPKKGKQIRCAADAPSPDKYVAKNAAKSPQLPLKHPISPTTTTMSATKTTTAADHTAILTPASHFVRWPTNREIPAEKVKIMTDSIRKSGIINPIIARTLPGKPELEIIAGETRWKAAKAIDPEFLIPTFIRTLSDKDAAMLHAIDNFQRNDLNSIEQAREIQHMLDTGWNLDEIMDRLGLAKDSIYNRLALLKLPEEGQNAFLEGNLSMHTVRKIMSLPEEVRVSAIEAVTSPTHSAAAMAEREAVAFIQKRFVLPAEQAAAWEEKHQLLTTENPGSQWLKYDQAKDAERHFCRAAEIPSWRYLSDAARAEELVVPTWGDLAKKHGSPIYIGMNYQGDPALFVSPDPIVDAEKALMEDKPEECIFTHEKAVQKNRDAAERKKLEQQAHREALAAETKKLQNLILTPDGLKATVIKKLVEATVFEVWEFYLEFSELADLFDIPEETEWDARQKKIETAVFKYLRSKSFTPFEAMARVHMAGALGGNLTATNVLAIFDSGACKPTEFPAHHIEYLKAAEHAAEEAKRKEEREEARREAIARGDAPTGEENAA